MGSSDRFYGSDGSGLGHWQKGCIFTWPIANSCKRLLALSEALCNGHGLPAFSGYSFVLLFSFYISP